MEDPGAGARYADQVQLILSQIGALHDAFCRGDDFQGPKLFFHQRALSTRNGAMNSH